MLLLRSFLSLLFLLPGVAVAATDDDLEGRIIGGENGVPGRHPYEVSLINTAFFLGHSCGGALIAPDIVLTSAACLGSFFNPTQIAARIGSYFRREPLKDTVTLPITEIVVHPQYNVQGLPFDLALLKLDGADFTHPPITLNTNPDLPVLGQSLTAMGRGDYIEGFSWPVVALQVTDDATYINTTSCNDLQPFLGGTPGFPFGDEVLCTLEPQGVGPCDRDVGEYM